MSSKKVEFIKNFIFSYSKTFIAIFSGIIYTYTIANYLGPEKYGIINYYISFTLGILGICGIYFLQGLLWAFTPRYNSKYLFKITLKFQYLIISIPFLILILFSRNIVQFLNKSGYLFLTYCAFLLLLMPLYDSFITLFRGIKRFGKLLKVETIVSVTNLIFAILLVIILKMDIFGVLYAKIISIMFGSIIFLYYFKSLRFLNEKIDFAELKKYVKFAIPFSFSRRFKDQSFIVLMGIYVLEKELGLFYIAEKIVNQAINTFTSSLLNVIYPYMGEEHQDIEKVAYYASLNIKIAYVASTFLGLFIIIISKPILNYLFPEFVEAYLLIPLFVLLNLIGSLTILRNIYISLNRMDILAKVEIYGLFTTIALGLLLMPKFGVYGAISTLIISNLIINLLYIHNLKEVDAKVELILRKKDLNYFFNSFKEFLLKL